MLAFQRRSDPVKQKHGSQERTSFGIQRKAQENANIQMPRYLRTSPKTGDKYEQEADRVADQVTSFSGPQLQRAEVGGLQGSEWQNGQGTSEYSQSDSLQPDDSGEMGPPPLVHEVLQSSGQPLDSSTREFMESRFGYDFSPVRLHTDARAEESARELNAHAYTVGGDIAFGARQFTPHTADGRRLLAHELTHVIQNRPTTIQRQATEGESLLPRVSPWGIGTVDNQTGKTFIAKASAGQEGEKMLVKLAPGTWGASQPALGPKGEELNDIDFVIATPTTPINGQTKGAFKIGSNDATISDDPVDKNNSKIDDFTRYTEQIPR